MQGGVPHFTVMVDIMAPNFKRGSRRYERVQWCLSPDRLQHMTVMRMAAVWAPSADDGSLRGRCGDIDFAGAWQAKLARDGAGGSDGGSGGGGSVTVKARRVALTYESFEFPDLAIPRIDVGDFLAPLMATNARSKRKLTGNDDDGAGAGDEGVATEAITESPWFDAVSVDKLYEWVGMRTARIDERNPFGAPSSPPPSRDAQEFLGEWEYPFPTVQGSGASLRVEGLVSTDLLQRLIDQAHDVVAATAAADGDVDTAWVAVTVWGVEDACVSWDGAEHGYLWGGENMYTLFVFPGRRVCAVVARGAADARV